MFIRKKKIILFTCLNLFWSMANSRTSKCMYKSTSGMSMFCACFGLAGTLGVETTADGISTFFTSIGAG
jgi:hypothetical protein